MAQLVLGTVGAVVGGLIGGPMGASIGWAIGGAVGSAIDPQKVEGPRLDDLKVTASAYGAPVPAIYGHPRISGNIIWCSEKREIATTERQGKGGGPEVTSYTYEIDMLVLLSDSPQVGVRRIWSNGKLVWTIADVSSEESIEASEDGEAWREIRVYPGEDDQLPDPTYEAAVGAGNAPAYRGRLTVMLVGVSLGSSGQLPNFTFEIGSGQPGEDVTARLEFRECWGTDQQKWPYGMDGVPCGALGSTPTALTVAFSNDRDYPLGRVTTYTATGKASRPWPAGAAYTRPARGNSDISTVASGVISGLPYVHFTGNFNHQFLADFGDWLGLEQVRYSLRANVLAVSSMAPAGEGAGSYSGCIGAQCRIYVQRVQTGEVGVIEHGSPVTSLAVCSGIVYAVTDGMVYAYDLDTRAALGSIGSPGGDGLVIFPSLEGELFAANEAAEIFKYYDPDPDPQGEPVPEWVKVSRLGYKDESGNRVLLGTGTAKHSVRGGRVYAVIAKKTPRPGTADEIRWFSDGLTDPDQEYLFFRTLREAIELRWVPYLNQLFKGFDGLPSASRGMAANVLSIYPHDPIYWARWQAVEQAEVFFAWELVLRGYPYDAGRYPGEVEQQTRTQYCTAVVWHSDVENMELCGEVYSAPVMPGASDASPVPLADVVGDLCQRCGVPSGDVDVSSLQGQEVHALAVQPTAARAVLEQLATAYYFECCESDRLYFRRRGGAPAVSVPYDHYGAEGVLALQDRNDLELPAQVNVSYLNLSNAFQQGNEVSDRLTTDSAATVNVQLGIGLTPPMAKAIADTAVLDLTIAARTGSVSLDVRYASLEPTDVVLLRDVSGLQHRARVVKVADAAGVRSMEVVADDARVLRELGVTGEEYDDDYVVTPLAETDLAVLDIPLLRDQDDSPGLYVAGDGRAGRWPGYLLMRDGVEVGRTTSGAAMGVVVEALGPWSSLLVDETHILTVTLNPGDQLVSITHADLSTTTANYAAIGAPGRWEIVQYQRAVLVSAGVYRVSGLARGRLGTEHLRGTHAAGDRFVGLDGAGLLRDASNLADLGIPRTYSAVTVGARVEDGTAVAVTPAWQGLRPLSPVGARQLKQGNGDIVLAWGRRSRYASNVLMGVLPLGEATERYEVDILDSGGAVVRTLSSTTPMVTYSATQQVADFGAQRASVAARIYQLSASVGRGQPASI